MDKLKKKILLVEDEDVIRSSLVKLLERHNYVVSEAISVRSALDRFNTNEFDLIISDLRLPGGSGSDLIGNVGSIPVIIMTSYASLRSAVDIMRQGAADYISKPFDHDELIQAVKRVIQEYGIDANAGKNSLIWGESPETLKTLHAIRILASTDNSVLIRGENGSGKKAVALAIHNASKNGVKTFCPINCITANEANYEYLIDMADCGRIGSLFLENLCEVPLNLQPLVLKLIETNSFRCIASSLKDLQLLSELGTFRKDLFLKINGSSLEIKPLRERSADIVPLCKHFIDIFSKEMGYQLSLSEESFNHLVRNPWPGNISELKNRLNQAALSIGCDGTITPEILGFKEDSIVIQERKLISSNPNIQEGKASVEEYLIQYVLKNQSQMNETTLAKNLGISRKSLWQRRKKLGVSR
jgi:DNA-binding NtrC family response regulator